MSKSKKPALVVWSRPIPERCQLCECPLDQARVFYDGVQRKDGTSRWAIMCLKCFRDWGFGVGTGSGQRYEFNPQSLLWEKTAG